MTEKEYMRGNLITAVEAGSGQSGLKQTARITIVPLFLLAAVMSQSFIGYYAEDYYAQQPRPQGLNLGAIKEHALSLRDKTIKGINIADLENLIKFECKK